MFFENETANIITARLFAPMVKLGSYAVVFEADVDDDVRTVADTRSARFNLSVPKPSVAVIDRAQGSTPTSFMGILLDTTPVEKLKSRTGDNFYEKRTMTLRVLLEDGSWRRVRVQLWGKDAVELHVEGIVVAALGVVPVNSQFDTGFTTGGGSGVVYHVHTPQAQALLRVNRLDPLVRPTMILPSGVELEEQGQGGSSTPASARSKPKASRAAAPASASSKTKQ